MPDARPFPIRLYLGLAAFGAVCLLTGFQLGRGQAAPASLTEGLAWFLIPLSLTLALGLGYLIGVQQWGRNAPREDSLHGPMP